MKIAILVDDINSWFVPYSKLLRDKLVASGYQVIEYNESKDVQEEEVCFILSCTKILKCDFLRRHKHNIVVHASDLPKGKGFTPLKWQILEGKNEITMTLFEAVEACDAGPYYFKDIIRFEGYEMLREMQKKMAEKIIEMCCRFLENIDIIKPIEQIGESTFYRRICEKDDIVDINSSIKDLFLRFRIADFDRFPLIFENNGHRYSLVVKRID